MGEQRRRTFDTKSLVKERLPSSAGAIASLFVGQAGNLWAQSLEHGAAGSARANLPGRGGGKVCGSEWGEKKELKNRKEEVFWVEPKILE